MTDDDGDRQPADDSWSEGFAPSRHWIQPDVQDDGSGLCRRCGVFDDCFCNEWMFE